MASQSTQQPAGRPLAGRVVLVTGASRRIGIGAAIARRVARDGGALLLHGWEQHDAEQPWGADAGGRQALAQELTARGAQVRSVSADLADPLAPERLVQTAHETFGRLDAVVANHARSSGQSLAELTAAELDLSYAVNVRATLLLVQQWAARQAGPGRVVLFTSGQHHGAMPQELPYVATKGALQQLTASLAVPLIRRGITVNCIDPGPTDTGYADEAGRRAVAQASPAGRWGRPEETARLVGWLLSDEAAWVTGQTIASDGGWSVR